MSLLTAFLGIVQDWRNVFPQQRTFQRGVRQALGSLVCLGRRCLTRIIWTNGGQDRSWSAEYFLHSRCRWEPQELFRPILKQALEYCPQRLVGVAIDDTRLRKTGRSIPQAFYQRDPLSPPFHVNLVLGLRFLQASLLVPLHRNAPVGTRALPIRFQEVSRVKRPGKRATQEMHQQYREAVKQKNLSRSFVEMGQQLRQELDNAGGRNKILVLAGDGSFCNRTCFAEIPERSVLLVRARKDAKLCFGHLIPGRRAPGVFMRPTSSRLNRFVRTRGANGKLPSSFMAANAARSAIKKSPRCTGSAALNSVPFVSSSSRRRPIARVRARSCTTAIRHTC
jgi:DDE superfamily endonuclease